MTVAENIFLGQEPAGRYIKLIDKKEIKSGGAKADGRSGTDQ